MTIPLLTHTQYLQLLKTHDWEYAHSEDRRVYQKGKAERALLEVAQPIYDKVGHLWNKRASPDNRLFWYRHANCGNILFSGWRCPTCVELMKQRDKSS